MSAAHTPGRMDGKPSVHQAMRDGSVRTYGELITVARSSSYYGRCCACHDWGKETWWLSTRASICEDCAKRKANQVLGSIQRAERRARHWLKRVGCDGDRLIATVTGASLEFIAKERAKLAKADA